MGGPGPIGTKGKDDVGAAGRGRTHGPGGDAGSAKAGLKGMGGYRDQQQAVAPSPPSSASITYAYPGRRLVINRGSKLGISEGMCFQVETEAGPIVGRVSQVFPFRSVVKFAVFDKSLRKFVLDVGKRDGKLLRRGEGTVTTMRALGEQLRKRRAPDKGEEEAAREPAADAPSAPEEPSVTVDPEVFLEYGRLERKVYVTVRLQGGETDEVEVEVRYVKDSPRATARRVRRAVMHSLQKAGVNDSRAAWNTLKGSLQPQIFQYFPGEYAPAGTRPVR